MRARIERDDLRHALKTVLPAVGKTNLAVLNGVQIVCDQKAGTLTFTCSDLQLTITAVAEAHIIAPGQMVAPARLLASFADKAPAGAVTIELDDHQVLVTAGDATAALHALPVDDWPRIAVAVGDPVTLSASHVDLIRRILPFAGTDDARPILTGLFLSGDKAAATDSYRLGEATLDGADLPPALIPAGAVKAALNGAEGVDVTVGERCATFAHDGASWTTVLLEGEYPPYDRLFRDKSEHYLTFNIERLNEALKRVGVVGARAKRDGKRSPVRIQRDGDKARVWQLTQDVGQVDDVVPCEGDFDLSLGLNPDFLAQMIAAAGSEDVTIELVDALKPVMARAEGLRLLLMPTRLA